MHLLDPEGYQATPGRVTKGQASENIQLCKKPMPDPRGYLGGLGLYRFGQASFKAALGRITKGQAFETYNLVRNR